MKANELRIGSYVYFKDEVLFFEFESGWNFQYIKPIPLTEDWLLKLGFEYYAPLSHYRIVINDIWYKVKITFDGQFLFSFINLNYDEVNHMPPKYIGTVHQLQNLYFSLTGEELILQK